MSTTAINDHDKPLICRRRAHYALSAPKAAAEDVLYRQSRHGNPYLSQAIYAYAQQ